MAPPEAANYVEWIDLAYNANPASLSQRSNIELPVAPQSALSFHDKHLDQSLSLRHVKPLPSLIADLSDVATELRQDVTTLGFSLSEIGRYFLVEPVRYPNMDDAMSVVDHYLKYVAEPCCSLASALAYHPTCPKWTSVLGWHGRARARTNNFFVDWY